MNIDKINLDHMKQLRQWSNPTLNNASNFERLCGLGLIFIGMWLDQEISDKEKLHGSK